MCGIAGIFRFDGAPADAESARAMARCLAHRGPDGEGVYASGSVALSFRRLSIIDLSENGSQPMCNEDGSLWLTFNGEIYNYVELMPVLQGRGHRFRSHCDSEVILHTYEDEGEDCTTRFNGMWAFALWDSRRRRLILSRDRLGEKPLYYARVPGALLFASEVKALLLVRPELAGINLRETAGFLAHGVTGGRPETFFPAIKQVPPGHTLTFEADGTERIQQYWRAPAPAEREEISDARAETEFRELLYDSIRLRLRSDVPVGTSLSGGLDSSTIVAVMCELLGGKPVHTFSSVFAEPRFNEERYIRAVNTAYPTVPHFITPSPDFMSVLPRILWHQEIPFAAPGVHAQWCVMDLARGKVKVLLDGQGADELLGGYFYYFPEQFADFLRTAWWPPAWGSLALALGRVTHRTSPIQAARLLKEGLKRAWGTPRDIGFQGGILRDHLSPELAAALDGVPPSDLPEEGHLASTLHQDLTFSSLPRLLHYQDRNSMAHGIESRVPYLDPRLVEFCLRLPDSLRIDAGVTKVLLRRAFRRELPDVVRHRVDKQGFSEPLGAWMRGDGYAPVADVLLSSRAVSRGITRRDRIEKALSEHRAGRNRTVLLYRVLTLELWFRLFRDGEGLERFRPAGLEAEVPASPNPPSA